MSVCIIAPLPIKTDSCDNLCTDARTRAKSVVECVRRVSHGRQYRATDSGIPFAKFRPLSPSCTSFFFPKVLVLFFFVFYFFVSHASRQRHVVADLYGFFFAKNICSFRRSYIILEYSPLESLSVCECWRDKKKKIQRCSMR